MSYASVASQNVPPPSEQLPSADNIADDSAKVNIVSADFKSIPVTYTSDGRSNDDYDDPPSEHDDRKRKSKKKTRQGYTEAEAEGEYIWGIIKQYLLRPGVAGGLVGLTNVGIIAGAGRAFYTDPLLRRDSAAIGLIVAGGLSLFSLEGYAAERYRRTSRGQEEERMAKEEGTLLYRHAHEIILRPGVLGGLLGLMNTTIIGIVGYFCYANWDKPSWDRRIVSAVSVGLLTLWGGEGYVAERYHKSKH